MEYCREIRPGWLRVYVHKTSDDLFRKFELLESEHFSTDLISDWTDDSHPDVLKLEIENCGVDDGFATAISEVLKNYEEGDVVEIVGPVVIEYSKYWTDCGYEYDAHTWFENEKHRKLTPEQAKMFLEEVAEKNGEEEIQGNAVGVHGDNDPCGKVDLCGPEGQDRE